VTRAAGVPITCATGCAAGITAGALHAVRTVVDTSGTAAGLLLLCGVATGCTPMVIGTDWLVSCPSAAE
jgi:hypothetical protein